MVGVNHSFLGLLRKGRTRRVGQTEPESVTGPNKHDFAVSLKDSAREGWDNVGGTGTKSQT